MNRISTGIKGLDSILKGGFPDYSTVLISGAPGSGKTILAQNYLFNLNMLTGDNVIYLTTLAEPQLKIIRYQQQFSFFNKDSFMKSVIYQDIGSTIKHKGVKETLAKINQLVKKHKPTLVVIDSIKVIEDFLPPELFRDFLAELNLFLPLWECSAVFISEYLEKDLIDKQISALVDGIIYLYGTEEKRHQHRYLRILKMRGTDFIAGEHIFIINEKGIHIFPRIIPGKNIKYMQDKRLQSSGTPGLDPMLGGGLPVGTATMINGPSGTGKSLLALNWLVDGAKKSEFSLLITFGQNKEQIISNGSSYGYDLSSLEEQGFLQIIHLSPVELNFEYLQYKIQSLAEENSIKRIVIDSITAFEIGIDDKLKFNDYILSLIDSLKCMGISVILINSNLELFNGGKSCSSQISTLADNIIFTQLIQDDFKMRRIIGVIKVTGGFCKSELKELILKPQEPLFVA